MFNILKKKTIEIHCYTDNKMVYDCFKIQQSTKFYPQWWKDLPKYSGTPKTISDTTMKGCYGFLELYKKSFVIPLWSDLLFSNEIEKNNFQYDSKQKNLNPKKLFFRNKEFTSDQHSIEQYLNSVNHKEWQQFKLNSPWYIECKENINFLALDCLYNRQDLFGKINLVPGMFNFFVLPQSNILGFVKINSEDFVIEAGTPMIHCIPITERPVKVFCHFDPYKTNLLASDSVFSFYNCGYKKLRQLFRIKNDKCPFTLK